MDHSSYQEPLQILNHIATVATATSAPVLPSNAKSTQFGPDGKEVRSNAVTSFAGVKLSASGQITGGTISQQTQTAAGEPLDSTTVAMTPDGKAGVVRSTIAARFAPGPYKVVEVDLSALQWTASSSVHSGTVAFTSRDAATNAVRTEGRLTFANEQLQSGTFAHRAWAGDGQVHGYTEVDYSGAKLVGMRLTGGQCNLTVKDATLKVLSKSSISLTTQGCVKQVSTQTYDPDSGQLKSQVAGDFSSVQFDPRGHISAGSAGFVVSDASGKQVSRTSSSFAGGVPKQTTTERLTQGAVRSRVVTSYEGVRFNNDLSAVGSDVVSTSYDSSGRATTVVTTSYDNHGQVSRRTIRRLDPTSGSTLGTTVADYSSAEFDPRGSTSGGTLTLTTTAADGRTTVTKHAIARRSGTPQPIGPAFAVSAARATPAPVYGRTQSEVKDATGAVTSRIDQITRPDGSLLQKTVTTINAGKPTRSVVTHYATDGTSVIGTNTIDLTALSYDATSGKASGSIGVSTSFRGVTPSARAVLSFGSTP